MPVVILTRIRRPGIRAARLRAVVRHALVRERCPARTEVSIVLVDDPTIRRLNRRHRRTDAVTDVLAFPAETPESHPRVLGDVVVSVERARVQARAVGHPVRTEVALLAVHGLLHLLGYDDRTGTGARTMMARQREILAEVGEEVRG